MAPFAIVLPLAAKKDKSYVCPLPFALFLVLVLGNHTRQRSTFPCPSASPKWSGPKLGWHRDDVNPHLEKYADVLLGGEDDAPNRIFVPLCGKSVDLAYLASHPKVSHVVGIDIVRDAAEDFAAENPRISVEEFRLEGRSEGGEGTECRRRELTERARNGSREQNFTFIVGDLFDLPPLIDDGRTKATADADEKTPELNFDAIYDRASMVAIEKSLRMDYVGLMGRLLRPGGVILLVTIDKRNTETDDAKRDGPPFSVDEEEIRGLYESQPWVESVTFLGEVNDLANDEDRARWAKKGVLELYEMVFSIKKRRE